MMNDNAKNLDDIVRNMGIASAHSQTPSQNPNDDTSASGNNFFDYLLNSVEYYDSKLRRKFKDLEFPGLILHTKLLKSRKELESLTCNAFANQIVKSSTKTHKYWEVHAYVQEISGLLPQPTFSDMMGYDDGTLDKSGRDRYETIVSRFTKFYCCRRNAPKIFECHRVLFPDENFFYYGLIEENSILHNSSVLKKNEKAILEKQTGAGNNASYPGGMMS